MTRYRTGLSKNYPNPPSGYNSVKGVGKYKPDPNGETQYCNIIVPMGTTILNNHPKIGFSYLNHNEYIVYDADRILIKFIVIFEQGKVTVPTVTID
jgi:hypothetical protein